MAGFLDPTERVIDMVLTDRGKQLLMAGDLRFSWFVPFDDEVDYSPPASPRSGQSLADRVQELTETPLVREATMGYRGTNLTEEDTTNLHRPMFSGPSGMGQTMALPQMALALASGTSAVVSVQQKKLSRLYVQSDGNGIEQRRIGPVPAGYQRFGSTEAALDASYSTGSYPADFKPEGFLVTVFVSSSLKVDDQGQAVGGFQEVVHNRDGTNNIAYRNDIRLSVYTP